MRSAFLLLLLCTASGLSAVAQRTAAKAASTQIPVPQVPVPQTTASQAVDPLLVRPVAQLTPDQIATLQRRLADWPNLNAFRDEDGRLPPTEHGRVVFLGDSITIAWKERDNNVFFPGKPYVNRGISGQTTAQMLLRFQQDVVALKPAAVVILGGINDLAGNAGVSTLPMIEDNFRSMIAIAQANDIRVIVASVLPSDKMPWRNNLNASQGIRELNRWLQGYAVTHHCTWLDYYSALTDTNGGMKPGLSKDGVHPTPAGYAVMAPLAQAAIEQALHQ